MKCLLWQIACEVYNPNFLHENWFWKCSIISLRCEKAFDERPHNLVLHSLICILVHVVQNDVTSLNNINPFTLEIALSGRVPTTTTFPVTMHTIRDATSNQVQGWIHRPQPLIHPNLDDICLFLRIPGNSAVVKNDLRYFWRRWGRCGSFFSRRRTEACCKGRSLDAPNDD